MIPVGLKKIVVVIKEEDLAQAIGKEGQNIRLASKMLEKEIDVYGDEEFAGFAEDKRNELVIEGYVPVAEEAMGEEEKEADPDDAALPAEEAPVSEEGEETKVLGDDEVVQAIVEDAVENVEEPDSELDGEEK